MIVDSSALVAIVTLERGYEVYRDALAQAGPARMSAATYLETAIVLDRGGPSLVRQLDRLLETAGVGIVPVTAEQARRAHRAHHDFGRGSGHPARLNFGDCFTYALAAETGEPLLFRGDDFARTDLRSALADPS